MAYVSKGAALGTSIPALVLGGLAFANQSNGCGNGILGGLFGNGNCNNGAGNAAFASVLAENGQLKAEKYADGVGTAVYAQTERNDKENRAEMLAFVKPIADKVAEQSIEIARLQERLTCCCEKQDLKDQFFASELGNLKALVNGITTVHIDGDKVCPPYMPRYNSWSAPAATAPTGVEVTNYSPAKAV